MNIITHLQFGDNQTGQYNKQYLVKECRAHFARGYSGFSPNTIPSCKSMEITVVAPTRSDLELYEWYISNGYKNGRIAFQMVSPFGQSDQPAMRYVTFDDAQCYAIRERYDIEVDELRLLTLSLSIQKCNIEDVDFLQQSINRI